MKKVLAIILTLALTAGCVVFLASCGNNSVEPETTAVTEAPVEEPSTDETEAPVEEPSADESTPAEESTEAPTEETTEETTVEKTTEAKKAPEGKEEIHLGFPHQILGGSLQEVPDHLDRGRAG